MLLYQFRYVRSRDPQAVLAFWSVSDTFIYNKYRFYSAVVLLRQFRYLGSQHTGAVLAFWSVSVPFIHQVHRCYSAVALPYQFRYIRSQNSQAALAFLPVSDIFIHNKHRLTRLTSFFTSSDIQEASIREHAVLAIFRFCYFYSQGTTLRINCCPSLYQFSCLKGRYTRAVQAFWLLFVTFIQNEHRF